MICRYLKLKGSVLYKRFCRENSKEERLGIFIGHIAVLGIVMFIAYIVFHFFMKDNLNMIHKGMFSVFVLVSFFSALDLYKEIYNKFYENKERELLLLMPMKRLSIVGIFFIELLKQYLIQFFLIFMPVICANCFIEERFIVKVFYIILTTIAVAICMVAVILSSYLLIANITKGKNVKNVSIVIVILATATSYFFAFFLSEFSDKLIGTRYDIIKVIFFPFIKVSEIILGNIHTDFFMSMLGCYLFASFILFACIRYCSYSISKGLLYYGTIQSGQRSAFIGILEFLAERFVGHQKETLQVLVKKDIIQLFSNWNIIKVVLQIFIVSLLLTVKMNFTQDGVGIAVIIFAKTIFLVYTIANYLYENETRFMALWILFPIKNIIWVREKIYIQNILLLVPVILMDAIIMLVNGNSICNSILLLALDVGSILLVNIITCTNNYLYAEGKKCEIAFQAKIKNICMLLGILLGLCVFYYIIKHICFRGIRMYRYMLVIALCCCFYVIMNMYVMKRNLDKIEKKRIYIEDVGEKNEYSSGI